MNISLGWFRLHRVLYEKPIWLKSTTPQKVILIALLGMVNHKEKQWEWRGKPYVCKSGQCITSLEKIMERCGKGVSIQNIRTALKRFEKMGFLTNESTRENRLITICNWTTYQQSKDEANIVPNNRITE
jgi:DNA replication protein DnaD